MVWPWPGRRKSYCKDQGGGWEGEGGDDVGDERTSGVRREKI